MEISKLNIVVDFVFQEDGIGAWERTHLETAGDFLMGGCSLCPQSYFSGRRVNVNSKLLQIGRKDDDSDMGSSSIKLARDFVRTQ